MKLAPGGFSKGGTFVKFLRAEEKTTKLYINVKVKAFWWILGKHLFFFFQNLIYAPVLIPVTFASAPTLFIVGKD